MLMQCKLIRDGGTVIELEGKEYHFKPNAAGDHVCEIDDESHVDRLLDIPEGYRPYTKVVAEPTDAELTGDSAERDALVAEYVAKFGKKPHYRASIETIKAELAGE